MSQPAQIIIIFKIRMPQKMYIEGDEHLANHQTLSVDRH
jgi:hypothetical protein